ncbi:MAG: cytochrome ubiquinol oxidase subunit I, partial [Muribaculaceae bacterium]|nr:cytochrome ubiquinol oxidase subunit I [Muribaculaceae bacterium]
TKTQPMKLAAMEGLYEGHAPQSLVAVGVVNPDKKWNNDEPEYLFDISLPYGLSILARHDYNAFVPGIKNIIEGVDVNEAGDTIYTVSYAERIARGKTAQEALKNYGIAMEQHDTVAMNKALTALEADYPYFGYGYFNNVEEAIPPVALTFYSFRVMVILGSFFLLFFIACLVWVYKSEDTFSKARWMQLISMIALPLMYLCSQSGWIVAEVGRQPWTVQDLLPVGAAISNIPSSSVIVTFWMFAVIFTLLLIAEVGIMVHWINKGVKQSL